MRRINVEILKSIFIDNEGNINTEIIITFFTIITSLGIPALIWNRSKNYRIYQNYVRSTKKRIFNRLLFPWEEEKYKFGINYKRFYIKRLNIRNIDKTSRKVKIKKGVNMLFLGKPGSGKTTYINHLYLSQFTSINSIIHFYFGYRFYYAKAKDIINLPNESNDVLNGLFKENLRSRVFIFLDGIDEVTIDNIDILVEKLIDLQKNNITIISTCRKEEHEVFLRINDNYAQTVDQIFEIGDWNEKQVLCYIKKYEKYANSNDFNSRIKKYRDNNLYSDFFKTPLEISQIIFIIDHSSELNTINNQYELYEQFLNKWIIRDYIKNGVAYENTNYIDKTMYFFSLCAYHISISGKVLSSYLQQYVPLHYCLNGLLKYERENEKKYIVGFYHLNFQDFFLSYFFFHSLMNISEKTIQALSVRYNHTVTRFIKNKLRLSEEKDLEKIKTTLLTIIYKLCGIPIKPLTVHNSSIPKQAKDYFNSLHEDIKIVVRNEIYFFLARLPWNQNNHTSEFLGVLQNAYQHETDIRAKRTIAISATILGDENLELRYAKEILYNADSNLTDRSFTLVYYQDVSHSNLFTYVDDNVTQWTNSRSSRINRLNSNDEKSLRMRCFDLITILNFVKSRNGYTPNQFEYEVINNCNINCSIYSNEKKQLLCAVKNELLDLLASN